ncbi:hypothetical protein NL676_001737 [Syzygium grande]|nr:hypothetical protein NL676_001737 [Syzygium grande]
MGHCTDDTRPWTSGRSGDRYRREKYLPRSRATPIVSLLYGSSGGSLSSLVSGTEETGATVKGGDGDTLGRLRGGSATCVATRRRRLP